MIDLSQVSCCLITKDPYYPKEILEHVSQFPFGEILILTNCDSPFRKYELIKKAKHNWIYYQDDDAICPIRDLALITQPGIITVAMKESHFEAYRDKRMTMGLGWGAFFEKEQLEVLKKYTDKYGIDELFKRETEKILTHLNYPQRRACLYIRDLASAWNKDRLSMQPGHYENMPLIEERCKDLI